MIYIVLLLLTALFISLQVKAQECTNGSLALSYDQFDYPSSGSSSASGSWISVACQGSQVTVDIELEGSNDPSITRSCYSPYDNGIYTDHNGEGTSTLTFTYTFSRPIILKNMVIGDVDRVLSNYVDIVTLSADASLNVTLSSTNITITNSGTTVVTATGGGANDNGYITVSSSSPITTLTISYNDPVDTSGNRFITIKNDTIICCPISNTGTTSPTFSTTVTSVYSGASVDLATLHTGTTLSNATLEFFSSATLSTTTQLSSSTVNPTASTDYWAAYYDATRL